MYKVISFETTNQEINGQSVTPTVYGKKQDKKLLILITTPSKKKKPKEIVITFDQDTS